MDRAVDAELSDAICTWQTETGLGRGNETWRLGRDAAEGIG